ncbi:hypothetical protein [Hanstruepera flava]|uniref:hypothetical protein n=1 Tax=Hanstruepera flava TaxID=2930218 RepID=UPI002027E20C|nr:hypothetical protein [Hanstruepera flava]
MRKIKIINYILFLIFVSCNDSDDSIEESITDLNCSNNYALGIDIDIDEDGVNDFIIVCSKDLVGAMFPWDGGLFINISTYENAHILRKSYEGLFFLQTNDIIYAEQSLENGAWFEESRIMLSKLFYNDSGWNDEWFVNSNIEEYYMAFKLTNENTEKIGWIKFEFDTINGQFSIINKMITESDSLIIN